MFKFPDLAGITAVSRVGAITLPLPVGDVAKDQDFRSAQLQKGQDYFARVVSRVDARTALVEIEGQPLRMQFSEEPVAGKTLLLRYLGDTPHPSFMLLSREEHAEPSTQTHISQAARVIDQQLRQFQLEDRPTVYQASAPVSHHPQQAHLLAQDLRHAISGSGLFYESHLNQWHAGQRSLAALLREPQNQQLGELQQSQLMPQQLALLEQQRVVWQGEVWPGQPMAWMIALQPDEKRQQAEAPEEQAAMVSSELSLQLPQLGKVRARLQLQDGKLRINLLAADAATVSTMRAESRQLFEAIQQRGQALDSLQVAHESL